MNFRKSILLPPELTPLLRSNFINLFWDIAWWGFYIGSTAAFLAIYAARCGATPGQIGMLAAIPALTSLLLSLPVGRWLHRFPAGKATVWSAFGSRSLFLIYALLPWLFPAELQVQALLILAVLITIPTTVINISFSQFFVEAIPIEWRGFVVGTRIALMSFISFGVTLLSGVILNRVPFPGGYQIVFFIGFLGAILTVPVLKRVHPAIQHVGDPLNGKDMLIRRRFFPTIDEAGKIFIRVVLLLFFFNMTNNMIAPLIPDLVVNKLQFSDALISLASAVSTLLVFIVSVAMSRLGNRVRSRIGTGLGAVLLAIQAIILALVQDAPGFMLAVLIGGIASGILASAQYNYHINAIPPNERPNWLSWSLLLGSSATLLGALLGPALADISGVSLALIILGGFRLIVGLAIWSKG
jgi:MFS family permease